MGSIKRVEILSEVQSRLNVEAKDIAALSRTRTVGEVIAAMVNEIQGSSGSSGSSGSFSSAPAPAPAAPSSSGGSSGGAAEATRVVMEVLASKTGYDTEMIEDDMEL